MLRILAGLYRSRHLESPRGEDRTRPMTARVKESVFGLLRGWFEEARVLDLFAGVGTMGLEAASRGAREVVCVERDPAVLACLRRNIERLGCGDRVTVLAGDALAASTLARAGSPFDVVFMDPPYELMEEERSRERVLAAAARLREAMGDKGFLVLRRPVDPRTPPPPALPGFDGPEVHDYGKGMQVLLYCPAA
jgi:16S rRNA (guanine966-N2)-methyltransferase